MTIDGKRITEEVRSVTQRKVKSMKKSELALIMDTYKKDGAKRAKEVKDFNQSIREPDAFKGPDEDKGEIYGSGYWRVPGGIWNAPRFKNGYHPRAGTFIEDEELERVQGLFDLEPRNIDDK